MSASTATISGRSVCRLLRLGAAHPHRGRQATVLITADEAVEGTTVEHVLVVRRTGIDVPWTEGRDLWWHDTVDTASAEHTPEAFDSEHPLFLLYTSGTTGGPKGIMHTTGGYLTQAAYTHYYVFDIKPESDVYWCTADIGWVTGHTYITYGHWPTGRPRSSTRAHPHHRTSTAISR